MSLLLRKGKIFAELWNTGLVSSAFDEDLSPILCSCPTSATCVFVYTFVILLQVQQRRAELEQALAIRNT